MALTQVSSAGVKDGELVNADFHSAANIAKSKLENFVTNNADNRVITGSGTANTLNGEANLFFDGDKLGIGTTSPSRKLHVASSFIRVDDGYGLDTSGATEKVVLDAGFIGLTVANGERARLTTTGLGLGTTSPTNALEATSSGHTKLLVGTTGTAHATGIQITHADGNAGEQQWQLQTDASADGNLLVRNATTGNKIMIFDSDVYGVSIGGIDPEKMFEIQASNNGITDATEARNTLRFRCNDSTTNTNQPMGTILWTTNDSGNSSGKAAFITATDVDSTGKGQLLFGAGNPAAERMRLTSTGTGGQLLLNETSAFDSNVATQFRFDRTGDQARFIFRNRGNNASSRVRLILSTLNRAANADKFSGMEMYQSGGLTIFNGETDNAHSGINLFSGNWASLRLKNGNVSGTDVAHIAGYWGTSNGLMMEVGGPQSGTHKAIRFTTSHYGGERGFIGVTLGGTSYNSSSDYRLKQNIDGLTGAVARVKQLLPKRFQWKEDPTHTVDGFLAHEAADVVPESVTGEKDGKDMQVMDNSKLVPLLTAALKEIVSRVEALEAA
tara:strand:- start:77 stop:1747 length:1671 start_codon:yes stop_codon:yes gene_type:complete